MTEKQNSTKESILHSAKELFLKKGYHETTMSAIAENAGVGKGTVYWHFSSKDDLFKTMIRENAIVYTENLKSLLNKPLPPDTILKDFIEIGLRTIEENRELNHVFFNNIQLVDHDFKKQIFQKYNEMIKMVELVVERGIKEGVFRPCSANHVAIMIIGMINSVGGSIFHQGLQTSREMIDHLHDMILHGIVLHTNGREDDEE